MASKVDIFEVLERVDNFDIEYFANLSEEEKKGIAPYTLMLWMNGSKSPIQTLQLNAFMNTTVFELGTNHKDLLYKLALVSSDGKKKRYKWIKKKGKGKKFATCVDVISKYYRCSRAHALGYITALDVEFIENLAMEMGEQDDTLKKIRTEMK